MLVSPEDLFDDEIVLRVPDRCELSAQPTQIAARVVETVRMVDTEALNLALRNELQQAAVRCFEHCIVLRAKTREVVDVEKSAIVDLVRRHAPIREPVRLALEEPVQRRKRLAAVLDAVVGCDVAGDLRRDQRRRARDLRKSPFRNRDFVRAHLPLRFVRGAVMRQAMQRPDDALELDQRGLALELRRGSVRGALQEARIRRRVEREAVLEVEHAELAELLVELQG